MNKAKVFSTLVSVLFIFLFFPLTAHAIEYGGIGGKPAYPRADNPRSESIFIHTLEPGTIQEEGVVVINNSASQRTLTVYAADSTPSSGGGFACKQLSEPKTSVGAWITLEKSEVVLGPNTNEIVPFTISVPQNADVGEHNGCILIQEVKPETKDTKGMSLAFRTGIRVAVTIPGAIIKKLDIVGFSVSKNKNGIILTPKVKNSGNVSVDANTSIVTHSVLGANIFRQEGQKGGKYLVLRGDTSEWNFELKKPFWGGWYRSDLSVEYDNDKELIRLAGSSLFFSWPTPKGLAIEIAIPLFLIGLVGLVFILKTKKIRFGIITRENSKKMMITERR
jgi:hypothetical protein